MSRSVPALPPSADARKAEFLRVLGHPARIRLLQVLAAGERTVGALQAELGLDSSSTSQHLAALRRQGLVTGRRDGTSVHYRVKDRRVLAILETARTILRDRLEGDRALLDGLADEQTRRHGGGSAP